MAYEIKRFPDELALATSAAADWLMELERWRKAPDTAGRAYCVALSGGRIAKTFFTEIARQAAAGGASMAGVHFFWADERCVPPTDPESNYGIAKQLLFDPLKIPADQIHRLRGEANEAEALKEASDAITALASPKLGKGPPMFDMIFLGMGEDGHVASLFPGELPEAISDPAIYRTVTAVKPPPRRMTLGYGMLAAALEVWLLASGRGKEGALKESLSPKGGTPLSRVLRSRTRTRILTDIEFAP